MSYVELQVASNYSFLRGASHPDELVLTAAALGHPAIALTDRNSLAGTVRAHVAAKQAGLRLIVGCRLDLEDGFGLLVYPQDRAAYGRLCRLLTLGKTQAGKGGCLLTRDDLFAAGEGLTVIALPRDDAAFPDDLRQLKRHFGQDCFLAAQHLLRGDDAKRLYRLSRLAGETGLPLVATNDVHAHSPGRRPLQDILTCIRDHCTLETAGDRLEANAERHLKSAAEMARLFRDYPQAVARTLEIADRHRFSLDELSYEYAVDPVPDGLSPQQELERLTWAGLAERYPQGLPPRVGAQIRHELELIDRLGYAPYFLTVHDLVRFARSRGILCQGRGSAANSAVCYCLGITAVDPVRSDLLFERFISAERNEPPDIDVDFEHERREEVIQYIYGKYGRDRAGLTASVITYRSRSAIRDVGKALGLSQDVTAALANTVWGSSRDAIPDHHVKQAGLDPADPRLRLALDMAEQLKGFPRHLSQHVGGFVITRGPLCEVTPIARAAMAGRTVIEWDKDDLDALGILKIDVLALGMLSCIRRAFGLLAFHYGLDLTLANIPPEDAKVYDMLCRGDSLGVFQVESRAQMAMLPRLKPRNFYDLVIQVAIVRPGPIQGDMVHPYLRRRSQAEKVTYPSDALRQVLEKTLGVPLFQEQAMRIAIEGAGFTPSEADQLRRAMASFRRPGLIHAFRDKFIRGMTDNGYDPQFAEQCFRQIEGFGSYGFPESHASSFALLVYVSAWLKCHYPAAFACALLNSQPMGFYSPGQILRDALAHGVELRPVDVNHSDWDCSLERSGRFMALRLGFRQIQGLARKDAETLVLARASPYASPEDLWRRTGLPAAALELLAKADAYGSLGLGRRDALWAAKGLKESPLPLFAAAERREAKVHLPAPAPGEEIVEDYQAMRLSLRRHPLALLRAELQRDGLVPARTLLTMKDGARLALAGLVAVRQRPGSAKGIVFVTLEDESGVANIVVRPPIFESFRPELLRATLLRVEGRLQRDGMVIHVVAEKLADLTPLLNRLLPEEARPAPLHARRSPLKHESRDFH